MREASHTIATPVLAERRRSYRQPTATSAVVRQLPPPRSAAISTQSLDDLIRTELIADLDKTIQVSIVDVSLHGVGFRSAFNFDGSSLYSMVLGVGPLFLTARLKIARIERRADGTFDIGAEFC